MTIGFVLTTVLCGPCVSIAEEKTAPTLGQVLASPDKYQGKTLVLPQMVINAHEQQLGIPSFIVTQFLKQGAGEAAKYHLNDVLHGQGNCAIISSDGLYSKLEEAKSNGKLAEASAFTTVTLVVEKRKVKEREIWVGRITQIHYFGDDGKLILTLKEGN